MLVDVMSVLPEFHPENSHKRCFAKLYPPGNQYIPPMGKETHLPNCLQMGYASSREGIFRIWWFQIV